MNIIIFRSLKFNKYRIWGSLVFFSFALSLSYWLLMTPQGKSYLPVCLFHKFTGLHCPFCGSTRALQVFLEGDFLEALNYNIFLIFILPILLIFIFQEWFFFISSYRFKCINKFNSKIIKFLFILGVIFFILRNIPLYPFSLLAP